MDNSASIYLLLFCKATVSQSQGRSGGALLHPVHEPSHENRTIVNMSSYLLIDTSVYKTVLSMRSEREWVVESACVLLRCPTISWCSTKCTRINESHLFFMANCIV